MKKNIIIVVLSILSIISMTSLKSMSSRAAYWQKRSHAAEAVIDRCAEECKDYFLDVLMEGEEFNNWITLENDL